MKRLMKTTLALGAAAWMSMAGAMDPASNSFSQYINDKGEIQLPQNYRQNWTHLGSWMVPDAKAPGHGFHDVYTQNWAAKAYLRDGEFPDGSVLVKEVRKIESGAQTTGQAHWAGDTNIWFVMIKDKKQRFNGPHWGDGWGWALFDTKTPGKNISASYAETCQGCHIPAQNTDRVFIEGYPTLNR